MTNGDRIRQMSNEELAKIINTSSCYLCNYLGAKNCVKLSCHEGILSWLESEEE